MKKLKLEDVLHVKTSLRIIANQRKVRNSMDILDRLRSCGAISKENYVNELKELYEK